MNNVTQTFLSQYANSPTLTGLIEKFNAAIDPSSDIQQFYNNVFNINSAVGQGLDDWGQIVGVSRNLQITTSQQYFGFAEAYVSANGTQNPAPFNNAPFYNGAYVTSTYQLGDNQYRPLIIAKAFANISNLSVPAINFLLMYLFVYYQNLYAAVGYYVDGYTLDYDYTNYAYVKDGGDMVMTIVFNFQPTDLQLAILLNSGVFPRPCGVQINYQVITS